LAHTASGSGGRMSIPGQSLEATGSSPVIPATPVAHDAEP
jgi:hypothetical protein